MIPEENEAPPLSPPSALIARYIIDRKLIRKEVEPRVRVKVFLPRLDPRVEQLALSTFDVDGLEEGDRIQLCEAEVAIQAGRSLKGWRELPALEFYQHRLLCVRDGVPDRHVNVINWPAAPEERLAIAQELCERVSDYGSLYTTSNF